MRETYHATHNQYDECISQCLPFVNLLDFRVSKCISVLEGKQSVDETGREDEKILISTKHQLQARIQVL